MKKNRKPPKKILARPKKPPKQCRPSTYAKQNAFWPVLICAPCTPELVRAYSLSLQNMADLRVTNDINVIYNIKYRC